MLPPKERLSLIPIYILELLSVGIFISGVNITFKSNLNKFGESYIPRFIELSFPISVKLFLASIPTIFIVAQVALTFQFEENFRDWFPIILVCVGEIIYFWRINVHLKYINTK
jgi:hypothetical protein